MNSTQCEIQKVVGGFVYVDVNNNSVKDGSEKGIKKLKVDLVKDGNVINTVATLDTGYYEFNVCDGEYILIANYEHGDNSNLASNSILVNTENNVSYDFRILQQSGSRLELMAWGAVGLVSIGIFLFTKYLSARTSNSL